jgi:hypothetical protein
VAVVATSIVSVAAIKINFFTTASPTAISKSERILLPWRWLRILRKDEFGHPKG